jgi:parvulin-like peptidyl-prolyl isomerase
MTELGAMTIATINDTDVSARDLMAQLRFGDDDVFSELISQQVIIAAAEERGLAASLDEVQAAADELRRGLQLYDAKTAMDWLGDRNLTVDDLEKIARLRALEGKLKAAVAKGQIERYYAENQTQFGFVRLAHLVVDDEDLANELHTQITEDGGVWSQLVWDYSTDLESGFGNGYIGQFRRSHLAPAVAAAVFGVGQESIVGPVKTDNGWEIFKVLIEEQDEIKDVRDQIADAIYADWLGERINAVTLDVRL